MIIGPFFPFFNVAKFCLVMSNGLGVCSDHIDSVRYKKVFNT